MVMVIADLHVEIALCRTARSSGRRSEACENRRCGEPAAGEQVDASVDVAGAQVAPSEAVNGSAVQLEEQRARGRRSARPGHARGRAVRRMPPACRGRRSGRVEVSDEDARLPSPWSRPRDVGRVAEERDIGLAGVLREAVETGWPPLNSSKWSPPTRRDDEDRVVPPPTLRTRRPTARSVGGVQRPRPPRAGPRRLVRRLVQERGPSAAGRDRHGAERVGARRVEDVGPQACLADGLPAEAAVGGRSRC